MSLYANIGGMRLRLSKLQDNDEEAKLLRGFVGFLEEWEDVERVFQYQRLLYVLEIICFMVISCQHNDFLTERFGCDKTSELVSRKYYWPSLKKDVKTYIKGCDICLASKAVRHKFYGDL